MYQDGRQGSRHSDEERRYVRELADNVACRAVSAHNHLRSLAEDRARATIGNGTRHLLTTLPNDLSRFVSYDYHHDCNPRTWVKWPVPSEKPG